MNTNTMKIIGLAVVVVALFAVYSALHGIAQNAGKTNGLSLKIGGAFALSGDSSVTSWGEAGKNGAQMAVDDINARGGINGQKVELAIEDMQSTSRGSVSAVSKLINVDHVTAIVGPSWLDVYQGAESLSSVKNIVMITPDGGIEAINGSTVGKIIHKNVFSTWYRTDVKAKQIVEYMSVHGVKRLAGLYANDSYYADFSARIESYAKEKGIQIVDTERIGENATDVRTLTLKIKNSNPDAVFFGFYDEKNIFSFLKIHKETFSNIPLYGDEFVHDHYMKPEYKDLYEGTVYFHAAAPQSNFVQAYKARYGIDPVFGAGTAYDATMIVAKMLTDKGINTNSNLPDYDAYLRSTSFDTVSYGKMSFDEIGGVKTANNQFDLWKVGNNKIVKVN